MDNEIKAPDINTTLKRINEKIDSLNFQLGSTVPRKLSIFLPIITELRLLFLSPLIIISAGRKIKHNILDEEYNAIKFLFLGAKNFPEGPNDSIEPIITVPFDSCFEKEFLKGDKPQWQNCNLNYIDSAIIVRLDKKRCNACSEECPIIKEGKNIYIWLFGNKEQYKIKLYSYNIENKKWEEQTSNYKLPSTPTLSNDNKAQLKKAFCEIVKKYNKEIFSIEEKETEDLKKDLFPLEEYNNYFLEESNIPVSIEDLGIDENRLKIWFRKNLNECFDYLESKLNTKGLLSDREFQKLKDELRKENTFKNFVKMLNLSLQNTIFKRKEDPYIFLSRLSQTPYFKVIYDFFNRIEIRTKEKFKHRYINNVSYFLYFIATDDNLIRTVIFPPSIFSNKKINDFELFFTFIKYFKWKSPLFSIFPFYRGLSEYINETGYPDFIRIWRMEKEGTRELTSDIRIPYIVDLFEILDLRGDIFNTFQLPVVYTFIDFVNETKDRETLVKMINNEIQQKHLDLGKGEKILGKIHQADKKEIIEENLRELCRIYQDKELKEFLEVIKNKLSLFPYPVYNFTFNSTLLDNKDDNHILCDFWRDCFNLTWDSLFAAGFVQREQTALFKASLFEEATKSFKEAMRFPLIEESEERENEQRR